METIELNIAKCTKLIEENELATLELQILMAEYRANIEQLDAKNYYKKFEK
jgi:hypothetical protein